jgi:hypothetical protein
MSLNLNSSTASARSCLQVNSHQRHAVGLLRHGIGCAGLHSVACADGLPDLEAIRIFVIDPVEDSDARGTLPELAVHLIAELAWKVEEVDRHCEMCLLRRVCG